MVLDPRNLNSLWASVMVETLARLGIRYAILCPGSRSAPLTVAFAAHPQIEALSVLDERSGGFWALGLAKRTGIPVPVVCTSGTAAANFFPAVIEAHESGIPLLLLTADRPADLRQCASGQTIDQTKLYGTYPVWQTEMSLPDPGRLAYARQLMQQAVIQALSPGPVHINVPFGDPLAPTLDPHFVPPALDPESFFAAVHLSPQLATPWDPTLFQALNLGSRGLIIGGVAQPRDPHAYVAGVGSLSRCLGWPILADALSPLRAHLNPNLVTTYDTLLRDPHLAQTLRPDAVIQLGPLPTSKFLRACLQTWDPLVWIIDERRREWDPLRGRSQHWQLRIESCQDNHQHLEDPLPPSDYLAQWLDLDQKGQIHIEKAMQDLSGSLCEMRIPWVLSNLLPAHTAIFVANSNPVRDMESFWIPSQLPRPIYCNRGANGIDGTLSTALGVAHRGIPTVLITGDLALLHDTNGLLTLSQFQGSLVIVLINNQGGGIFEMLAIAEFDPPFEAYFATPQKVDFAALCGAYEISHVLIESWEQFIQVMVGDPCAGVRVVEMRTDRKRDAGWRKIWGSPILQHHDP